MGPKKQIKKEVIEQPPKEEVPDIPAHELQGYGRFSYPPSAEYTGQWRLFDGIKKKHGKGTLIVQKIQTSQTGKQMYEGEWNQDNMSGTGTYYYPDGSVYRGKWQNNEQFGYGVYEFPNGTVYEGQWEHNLMHGTGFFIDHTGRKWEGQYRKGRFETKHQDELNKEKALTLKKLEIKKEIESTLQALLQSIAKSDKKTLKENLAPFFASADNLKEYIKEPYAKLDQRPPEKWTQVTTVAKSGTYKILTNADEATLITPDRLLAPQLSGNGQFVEVQGNKDEKSVKIGLVGLDGNKWIIVVCTADEDKKK